ncbi:uncharacterized protein LOC113324124 [Papaver somniferum]|uniref:uncharacterized protein LOC113324124 n=1 Tax=Papaver somniferum TaxID=3469 RepID=UPI000E704E69|nr:uncharacterized protein LOC113324124 [Papaver somniferum]
MGFRDIACFNQALLAKAAWSLCQQQEQLWASTLKQRYFPATSALHANKKKDSTWAWQSIQSSMDFVIKHSFWIVGNGTNIQTWRENWIQGMLNPPIPTVSGDYQTRSFSIIVLP